MIQKARAALPEIEAARQAHRAREEAEREALFAARVAAEKPREFGWNDVASLVRAAGHEPDDWGSPSSLYGQALQIGVITDLEHEVARRRAGRSWYYAGD